MRLLDLYCGAGGAAKGYRDAGFDEIVGWDMSPQPRYPYDFCEGDALNVLADVDYLRTFDAIHASPPCQAYSRMRHLPWLKDREYPMLIDATKAGLIRAGIPWVIENVEDAPIERTSTLFNTHGCLLCGLMFGLPLYRHRVFESSFPLAQPSHPRHKQTIFGGKYLNKRYSRSDGVAGVIPPNVSIAGHTSGMMKYAPQAMGIDWMRRDELTQAIPPAMTEFIGRQLLVTLNEVRP